MLKKIFSIFQTEQTKEEIRYVFCSIPCECGEQVVLYQRLEPGQVAVLKCENCELSWSIYNPSLIIKKTKDLPEELQETWNKLSKEKI